MLDHDQETQIIAAFERGGCPAGTFDFKAEIDRSLSLEENLTQLEEKTGFKPRLRIKNPLASIDRQKQRLLERLTARGYTITEKDGKITAYKKNTASFFGPCKVKPLSLRLKRRKPVKVRMLKQIPGYKGAENEQFGPYQEGQITTMPQEEADWMIRGKLAEALRLELEVKQANAVKIEPEKPEVSPISTEKVALNVETSPKNELIYVENREISEPMNGKDGQFYTLTKDSVTWYVSSMAGQAKKGPIGAYEIIEACIFTKYREAWLFFLDSLEGKKPDCETWKMPKEAI